MAEEQNPRVGEKDLPLVTSMSEMKYVRGLNQNNDSVRIAKENLVLPAAQTTEMAEAIALAEGFATDAETAKTGAETAQGITEGFRDETEAFRNAAAAIVSGGPRGVYATLSDLITADPDHTYTYVVTADGHWYYWNGSTFADGGAYQTPLSLYNGLNKTEAGFALDARQGLVIQAASDAVNKKILYLSRNIITSGASFEGILTGSLDKNGTLKHIVVKNNSENAGYFTMTVYNTSFEVVFINTSSAVLVQPGEEYVIHLGNVSVSQIHFNNINGWVNYEVSVYNIDGRTPLYVGPARSITKFTDGLLEAINKGNVDLYVDAGVYDIVAELTESYMSSLTAAGHYGPIIGNGVKVYFASGSKVLCHYEGSDANVMERFSPLNALTSEDIGASDYEIHNINIDCSRVRYCVHDECSGAGQYTHTYNDCIMKLDNTNNTAWQSKQCIGGGLGKFSTIIIKGGEYNSVGLALTQGNNATISYHQPSTGAGSDFINKVDIKNIYCVEGTVLVSVLGDNTDLSIFECSNCSMKAAPYINGIDNPMVNHNFRIIAWNNEIRN